MSTPTPNPLTRSDDQARMIARNANVEADRIVQEDAESALALFYALASAIPASEFARLIKGDEMIGEPALICPHCTSSASGEDELTAVDYSTRWTGSQGLSDDGSPRFGYDGSDDYDALHYLCATCSRPVSLPEGVEEEVVY